MLTPSVHQQRRVPDMGTKEELQCVAGPVSQQTYWIGRGPLGESVSDERPGGKTMKLEQIPIECIAKGVKPPNNVMVLWLDVEHYIESITCRRT